MLIAAIVVSVATLAVSLSLRTESRRRAFGPRARVVIVVSELMGLAAIAVILTQLLSW